MSSKSNGPNRDVARFAVAKFEIRRVGRSARREDSTAPVSPANRVNLVEARGVISSVGGTRVLIPPFEFDAERLEVQHAPPTLGQRTDEILEGLE